MPAVVPPRPEEGSGCGSQGLELVGSSQSNPSSSQRAGRTHHPSPIPFLTVSTGSRRDWEAFHILCLGALHMLRCTRLSMVWISAVIFCRVKSVAPVGIHNQIRATQSRVFAGAKRSPPGLKAAVPEQADNLNQDLPRKPSTSNLLLLFVKTTENIIICLPGKESRL